MEFCYGNGIQFCGASFHSQNAFATPVDHHSTLGTDSNPRVAYVGQYTLMENLFHIFFTIFFALQHISSGAHTNQLSFLAPIIAKGPSRLSHCFQWAIMSFLLISYPKLSSQTTLGGKNPRPWRANITVSRPGVEKTSVLSHFINPSV